MSVTGELGRPLGQVFQINATIVSGERLGTKADDGRYVLDVTTVYGRRLDVTVQMRFAVPGFVRSQLASDKFELHDRVHSGPVDMLNSNQVGESEKGYVGRTVRATVYEVGEFAGAPSGLKVGSTGKNTALTSSPA